MHKMFLALALIFVMQSADSCDDQTPSAKEQNAKQEILQQQSNAQAGMPGITNFTEKKIVRKLYELRDQNIATFSYVMDMNGHLWHVCDSIGYGLPYGVQFTNPEQHIWSSSANNYNITQAEPNGLFMPSTAEGTWVICADPKGQPAPVYVEPRVIVSPFKMKAFGEFQ